MEDAVSSESSLDPYQGAVCHMPEDDNVVTHRHENPSSHTEEFIYKSR